MFIKTYWHDLRHSWATWQRQAGTPMHELQRLGGWKTAAMVERYAHIAPDNLAIAASRLNAVTIGYGTLEMKKSYIAERLGNTGGRGQNRTVDTRIFNPLLYRLSYPASAKNLLL